MTLNFVTFALALFVAAFLGGLVPLWIPQRQEKTLKLFVSLGAGLLLGIALVHMIPESQRLLPSSSGEWVLAGFLILVVLERFVMVHTCEEHGCDYHTVGIAAFIGLTIHGLIEGFALTSSLIATQIGHMVLLAIVVHKIPAAITLTSLLKLAKKGKKQVVLFITGTALSSPIGMWLAYGVLKQDVLPQSAGILLGLSAGTFLYISACDLLPEIHRDRQDKLRRLIFFLLGTFLALMGR